MQVPSFWFQRVNGEMCSASRKPEFPGQAVSDNYSLKCLLHEAGISCGIFHLLEHSDDMKWGKKRGNCGNKECYCYPLLKQRFNNLK